MQLLNKSVEPDFDSLYTDDIRESEKHEIISKISQCVDCGDLSLSKAEKIFEEVKFAMANFVMKHEYGAAYYDHQDMHFWLEEKANPEGAAQLDSIISAYLK